MEKDMTGTAMEYIGIGMGISAILILFAWYCSEVIKEDIKYYKNYYANKYNLDSDELDY